MRRALVDTAAWFAYLWRDDPQHPGVGRAIEAWQGRLVTTNFILDETMTLVKERLGHRHAVELGEELRQGSSVELVRLLPEDEEEAWELFVGNQDKRYSYTDCTSFAVMRRLRLAVAITLDRHFRQAGFEMEP